MLSSPSERPPELAFRDLERGWGAGDSPHQMGWTDESTSGRSRRIRLANTVTKGCRGRCYLVGVRIPAIVITETRAS